jgi:hypothetical protein
VTADLVIINSIIYSVTLQTTQSTPEPLGSQNITLTITGSGNASFSNSSPVTTATVTTNSSGQATVQIYGANGTNTMTAGITLANITHTNSITV